LVKWLNNYYSPITNYQLPIKMGLIAARPIVIQKSFVQSLANPACPEYFAKGETFAKDSTAGRTI